jgi:hypothetical protein
MSDDRLATIEQRLSKVEHDLGSFQATVVKRLSELLQLIQKQQKLRDAHINETLRGIMEELKQIRERLSNFTPTVMN